MRTYRWVNGLLEALFILDDGVIVGSCSPLDAHYVAWSEEGNSPQPANSPGIHAEKESALFRINHAYESEFTEIKSQYPDAERESWPVQLGESSALLSDPQASTPFLDALLVARGFSETKAGLAAKVQAKHQAYSAISAALTGKRHALERQILEASTVEEIQSISWSDS